MKAIRKNLAVLVVVMGVTLFFTGALASADDNQGEPTLAGVWQVEVTLLSACGQAGVVGHLPTLYTFTGDGKVIETPGTPLGLPGTLRTSPGLGSPRRGAVLAHRPRRRSGIVVLNASALEVCPPASVSESVPFMGVPVTPD